MRNSNTDGTTTLRKADNMGAFDKLPKALRQALANSDHNWSAHMVRECRRKKRVVTHNGYRFSFETTADAVQALRYQDEMKHRKDAADGWVCPGQR